MAIQNTEVLPIPAKRNWWKLAFFVMLVLFEIAREIAVLASAQVAKPSSFSFVSNFGDYVSATGTWKRIDGGERLLPVTVSIECQENTGKCIEAYTSMIQNTVFAPDISTFDAKFTPDMVTYENNLPTCVKYLVRIDRKIEKAFSVRELKDGTNKTDCPKMEKRIEMQISNGLDKSEPIIQDHFVPIIDTISYFAKLF